MPVLLLIIPAFQSKQTPLTRGGYVGILVLYLLCAALCTTFTMNRYWAQYLIIVTVGYVFYLAMYKLLHPTD